MSSAEKSASTMATKQVDTDFVQTATSLNKLQASIGKMKEEFESELKSEKEKVEEMGGEISSLKEKNAELDGKIKALIEEKTKAEEMWKRESACVSASLNMTKAQLEDEGKRSRSIQKELDDERKLNLSIKRKLDGIYKSFNGRSSCGGGDYDETAERKSKKQKIVPKYTPSPMPAYKEVTSPKCTQSKDAKSETAKKEAKPMVVDLEGEDEDEDMDEEETADENDKGSSHDETEDELSKYGSDEEKDDDGEEEKEALADDSNYFGLG